MFQLHVVQLLLHVYAIYEGADNSNLNSGRLTVGIEEAALFRNDSRTPSKFALCQRFTSVLHPPSSLAGRRYVQSLEAQLAQTQELLQKLATRLGDAELKTPNSQDFGVIGTTSRSASSSPPANPTPSSVDVGDSSEDEDVNKKSLEDALKNLCLGPSHPSFMGKSSSMDLCLQALGAKREFVAQTASIPSGQPNPTRRVHRTDKWFNDTWLSQAHQQLYSADSFPDTNLMASLVDLFFKYANTFMPLLHRQTFERGLREGLHLRDEGFGSTVLLVCAIGCRFSDDPRVLAEPGNGQTAGWEYFFRVQATRKAIKMTTPTLYDVQVPCVSQVTACALYW